jgi:hypothetical protein
VYISFNKTVPPLNVIVSRQSDLMYFIRLCMREICFLIPGYRLLLSFLILFSQVFPGTFPLEPVVNPTTQASIF